MAPAELRVYYMGMANPEVIIAGGEILIPAADNLFMRGTAPASPIELGATIMHDYNPWAVK
jgi:hypothetical protein